MFLGAMIIPVAASLMQPVASSLINAISEKGDMKGQEGGSLPLLALPLMVKAMSGKGFMRAGIVYNNMNHLDKSF